jgi:hypothetical protein
LTQYADDGIIMVSNAMSVKQALSTVKEFSNVAGPKLNMNKVEGIWLGTLQNSMPCNYEGIKWTNEAVRCLGVYVGNNKAQCNKLNWDEKIHKVKRMVLQWKRRNLTMFGKVVVIRTLLLPIVTHCATVLDPPESFISELNVILKNFICLKRHRLSLNTIIGTVEEGGINFPDLECLFQALKANWVARVIDPEKHSPCSNIMMYWCNKIGFSLKAIVKCNFRNVGEFPVIKKIPSFYQEILLAYNKCKTIKPVTNCLPYEIFSDVIWGNGRYRFNGKCLYVKHWLESGILYINDILDKSGKLKSENDLLTMLSNKQNWMAEYIMVKHACKTVENICTNYPCMQVKVDKNPTMYVKNAIYDVSVMETRDFYDILRNQKFKKPYMQKVWSRDLDLEILNFHLTWCNIYKYKVKLMPIKQLAEFNYKVLSGTLPCGKNLSKWIKDIPPLCKICNVTEDMKHMLYDCVNVRDIWICIGNKMKVDMKWKHIVVGYFLYQNSITKVLNWLSCLIAYSIFKCNNLCKWKETNYNECNVKKKVVTDLQSFQKMQMYFCEKYIADNILTDIINVLSALN